MRCPDDELSEMKLENFNPTLRDWDAGAFPPSGLDWIAKSCTIIRVLPYHVLYP
jgi:hypothetical protein